MDIPEESFVMNARSVTARSGFGSAGGSSPRMAHGGHFTMALTGKYPLELSATTLALLATITLASPARADRCDDLAAQLKGHIDGLSVGKTAANVIYLAHPAAKQLRLGCASRKVSNDLFATAEPRKPKPQFLDLVAKASAVIFTVPLDDMLKGVTRCISRMGILRGNDIKLRFRRLDMHCTRSRTEATIAISRNRDE
jgi:hypothetical protein